MIEIEVNNGRIMELTQPEQFGNIHCDIGKSGDTDTHFEISAGDMVMLMNYYRYQKENGKPIF